MICSFRIWYSNMFGTGSCTNLLHFNKQDLLCLSLPTLSTWQYMFLKNPYGMLFLYLIMLLTCWQLTSIIVRSSTSCFLFHSFTSLLLPQTEFLLEMCCWHQIQNEHTIIKNSEIISQFQLLICCISDISHYIWQFYDLKITPVCLCWHYFTQCLYCLGNMVVVLIFLEFIWTYIMVVVGDLQRGRDNWPWQRSAFFNSIQFLHGS